jgi:pullulanase/glycogen debranching enzyme
LSDRRLNYQGLPSLEKLIIYELHFGTFTPEGTFRAAAAKLPYLKELGVTAVEPLPIADFPGGKKEKTSFEPGSPTNLLQAAGTGDMMVSRCTLPHGYRLPFEY